MDISCVHYLLKKGTICEFILSKFFLLTGLKTRTKFTKRKVGRKYASFEES